MFQLTEEMIKEEASSDEVFKRGKEYYAKRKIKSLNWDQHFMRAYGDIEGTDHIYETSIWFDEYGQIQDVECNCQAFRNYLGGCKHTVAMLMAIKAQQEKIRKIIGTQMRQERTMTDDFFNAFESYVDVPYKKVKLEITYHMDIYGDIEDGPGHYITLRMGESRPYVVKNMRTFFEKLEKNQTIFFGKNFEFVPGVHKFEGRDQRIIQIFKELYDTECMVQSSYYYYRGNSGSGLFRGQKSYIPEVMMQRFFEVLEGSTFHANILGREYKDIEIIEGSIPIEVEIGEEEKDLTVRLQDRHQLVSLTRDGKYQFYKGKIYKTSALQQKYFPAIMNMFTKGDIACFKEQHKSRFLSEVVPHIKKIGQVKISDKIKDQLLQAPVEPKIYMDAEGRKITARPVFQYGEYKIEPVVTKESDATDKIVIRDIEKEKQILAIFEELEFMVSKDHFALKDEEKIFEFVYEKIPELQKLAEIYYSEEFKNFQVLNPSKFKSGVRLNSDLDFLEFTFEHEAFGPDEYANVLESLHKRKKFHRLRNGSFLPLDNTELVDMMHMMEDLGIDSLEDSIVRLPKYRAMYMDNQIKEQGLKQVRRNQLFKQLVQNITEPADLDYSVPEPVDGVLRSYQETGFKWLKTLAAYGMGGILADDMGLGKTLQTIAFLLSEKGSGKPSLVVAPTSLVYNWESECKKFAPELKVGMMTGTKKQRKQMLEELGEYDLLVTSYGLIRRDTEMYEGAAFEYCFLDEAQHIKNAASKGAKAVKKLLAKSRFALTGTPMENALTELWSIFDYIMPGYLLSHKQFVEKYESPIVKEADEMVMKRLTLQIRPFILRRMKKEVLTELPEKLETKMMTELTKEQKKVYMAFLQQAKGEMNQEITERGWGQSQIKILTLLTRLRQLCCDPAVFLDNYTGGSAKMDLLEEVVTDAVAGGHRMLIFSQFTGMLDEIGERLSNVNINCFRLDGSTPMKKRGQMVNDFNEGQGDAFLISLKAGGTGLNLTGADMVIHFDPWWNPAVEDQATDRAYRIGQTQKVQVLKLIAKGTIEEKIDQLQQKKKEMAEAILKPGETMISKMSEDEIRALFEEV